ncbi:MAG: TAT-variant-translocated molybdopterin oxidoreductase [Candidatus Acidiferrales bacterium]
MSSDLNPKIPSPTEAAGLPDSIDLAAVRAKLAQENGKRFWQSLEELSETKEYREFLENEFPHDPAKDPQGINRRDVLKLAAASAALAGLSACTKLPTQKIVPYVKAPEEIVAGKPLFYATSMPLAGVAAGLLVESHMGRPTKIEGNSEHPGSLGATDVFAQAATLGLYDPDRSQTIVHEGRISDWGAFVTAMGNAKAQLADGGAGLRILTDTVTSPSLAALIRAVLTQFPQAKWHQYEQCGRDNVREGTRAAFGKPMNPVYRFDQAEVVVSLDADFICSGAGHVRYARDFASRRAIEGPSSSLNRLYVIESMTTSTGAIADHRKAIRASDVESFARELAAQLGVAGAGGGGAASKIPAAWTQAAAKDLSAHRGASLVIAGDEQPPAVHAMAHAINAALGNAGKTVYYTEPIEANPVNELESLRDLVNDINAGKVELLFMLGDGNPVYDAPVDFDFGPALLKVNARVHSGLYYDETAELCHWHVPAAHFLEMWGDARAYDGTIGVIQPLIQPLYDGHSPYEVIAVLTKDAGKPGHEIVRDYWQSQRPEKDKAFEAFWERSLHDGLMAGSALPASSVAARPDFAKDAQQQPAGEGLEISFKPDPSIFDGRFANNGWLQELPKPNTRLTWDNGAMVSPATAQRLGLEAGDYVKLQVAGRETKAGVVLVPGHAEDSITLHLGYGRRRAGSVGSGPGFNANFIRTSATPWIASGLKVEKTGDKYYFAVTQHQYIIDQDGHPAAEKESVEEGRRDLVRIATLDEYRQNPNFAQDPHEEATKGLSLYPGYKYEGYAWGMAVDLNKCVGCNACVVACQAENNIPVVGKEQVMKGRAMHWIRVDTYFRGDIDAPETYYEPVLCMHCENAPCEVVCPVGATVHSPEGLNEMVYNRCVGTRYCSNNCPYKVRRFNFLLFSDYTTPSLFGMRNPNVTVRSRGVMEKCTYCVQRINAAKINSEEENRSVRDGEIVTACQAVCPGEALVFGNINDPNSRVAKLKAQSRNYGLLNDLNTRPRTTYLARVRNPNPEIHE